MDSFKNICVKTCLLSCVSAYPPHLHQEEQIITEA